MTIVTTDSIHRNAPPRFRHISNPAPFEVDVKVMRFVSGNQGQLKEHGTVRRWVKFMRTSYPEGGFFGCCSAVVADETRWVPTVKLHGKCYILRYSKEEHQPDSDYRLDPTVTLPSSVEIATTCPCCGCKAEQSLEEWASTGE